jgi:type I restriction enzyme S subunit
MTFRKLKLGQIATMKYGKMPSKEVIASTGYPIYSGYRVVGYSNQFLYKDPMLIVVARGVGGTGDVKISPHNSWITNLSIVLDIDNNQANKHYLQYKLKTEKLKNKLDTGSAQSQITIDTLSRYEIEVPSIVVQQKIASILSAYDDLIENNNKRIKTLEKIAELTYKELFYANKDNRWGTELVGNVLSPIKRTAKVKKDSYQNKGLLPIIDQSEKYIGGYINDKSLAITTYPVVIFGDHTRILKYVNFPFVCGADGTQILFSKLLPTEYLYFAIKNLNLSNYHYARHFKFLKAEKITVPDDVSLTKFQKFSEPIFLEIWVLRQKNSLLTEVKEILLPKLISGELDVEGLDIKIRPEIL